MNRLSTPGSGSLLDAPPFRMTRLEVFNWGTFDGRHTIDIAETGFLFVGSSGSGKSTLLDAISALLVPPRWVDFNAAARENERSRRDRNLVTYVRGAWSENSDERTGEVAKRYLRTGTTWSAIALRYANALGEIVTLAELFWLRGNGNATTDVRKHYLVADRDLPLDALGVFGEGDLDLRKLKAALPDVGHFPEFSNYRERFCSRLGIDSEMALRLLHKTQSAKNLGDLNAFLREFMLDEPETFTVAERLVDEFGELKSAHAAVVKARRQIETLTPARAAYERTATLDQTLARLDAEREALDPFFERRRVALLEDARTDLLRRRAALEDGHRIARRDLDDANAACRDLEARRRAVGGDRLETWEAQRKDLEREAATLAARRDDAAARCEALDLTLPDTPETFAELVDEQRRALDAASAERKSTRTLHGAASVSLHEAQQAFTLARAEADGLSRRDSNIPEREVRMRERLADALGLDESALPFVGELIQVREEAAQWRGGIERVLRPFALSLLVDERHHTAVADTINGLELGGRLTYLRVDPDAVRQGGDRSGDSSNGGTRGRTGGRAGGRSGGPAASRHGRVDADSLVHKVELRRGRWQAWLQHELERRFDYTCTDDLGRFASLERALTSRGLVKHNRVRHEKDDRSGLDDRRHHVLGFDNREKRTLLQARVAELGAALARSQSSLDALERDDDRERVRHEQRARLVDTRWEDIDPAPALARARTLDDMIHAARDDNVELAGIDAELERARAGERARDDVLRKATLALDRNREEEQTTEKKLAKARERLDATDEEPDPDGLAALDERLAAHGAPTLDTLQERWRELQGTVEREHGEAATERTRQHGHVVTAFKDFLRIWPGESDGLDATLDSAGDFLGKLARLESDGLPAHETRFLELLETQSHQNLAALSSYLNDARRAIHDRLDLVNDSLSRVPFNRDGERETFLVIEPSDRHLPDVVAFRQSLRAVLENAYTRDAALAEKRFEELETLVGRLGSEETADRRWRELVLDVRLHVDFMGRENDADGRQVEVYRSGAGKSGGQRQKLATTCLAAALRYQLGGADRAAPVYSSVVLDEAFDKADNEFTDLAMRIFGEFGFQMIVATPMKSVMTLEPHIGGACFVDIRDRRRSSALSIAYDADAQRLRLGDVPPDA